MYTNCDLMTTGGHEVGIKSINLILSPLLHLLYYSGFVAGGYFYNLIHKL